MKTYNRLKRMKKSTKVSLLSCAVYTATALAVPAFANQAELPVFQPVNIEHITSIEQAKNVYNAKLAEYSQDKKMTFDELTQLAKIKRKERTILKTQLEPLEKEKQELETKLGLVDRTVKPYKEKLTDLDVQLQNPDVKKILEENLKDYEKQILEYYPGLIDRGNMGIIYDAKTELHYNFREAFNNIVGKTHDILKENYGDESLKDIRGRTITLREVVAFHKILTKKISMLKETGKIEDHSLLSTKQDLINKINDLESEKNTIINSGLIKKLETKIEPLNEQIRQISRSPVVEYSERHEAIKEFLLWSSNKDLSRYRSLSLVDLCRHYGDYDAKKLRQNWGDGNKLMTKLEPYFKEQGFEVDIVDKLPNPTIPKWPLWTIPIVLAAPILRNILLMSYLGGGKQNGEDYWASFGFGMAENALFYTIFDVFHPLVFPIRMVAVPVVWHGLLKITGGDKAIYNYADR